MILGLGTDVCPAARWARLMERHGPRCVHRILGEAEAAELLASPAHRLAERLAGRWALREAFGKALGCGLDGWSWRELRYREGRLWAEGALETLLKARGVIRLHASLTHDAGSAWAVVILESGPI